MTNLRNLQASLAVHFIGLKILQGYSTSFYQSGSEAATGLVVVCCKSTNSLGALLIVKEQGCTGRHVEIVIEEVNI